MENRSCGAGALLRVPGFSLLYAGLLLGRMAGSMLFVALILFVLERYHSPQLAGATAFMAALPGILVSPLAGALLDRLRPAPLVGPDYSGPAGGPGALGPPSRPVPSCIPASLP